MNAIIGQPISRVDGPAKVTGQAIYAAEFNLRNVAYAALVHKHDCARPHRALGCHERGAGTRRAGRHIASEC